MVKVKHYFEGKHNAYITFVGGELTKKISFIRWEQD